MPKIDACFANTSAIIETTPINRRPETKNTRYTSNGKQTRMKIMKLNKENANTDKLFAIS